MFNDAHVRRTIAGATAQEVDRLLRRLTCQLDFAAGLKDLHPEVDVPIADLKQRAAAFDGDLEGLRALVAETERALAPMVDVAKTYTVHCVGHGHIDMNWMWSYPETVATTHDTFASVLQIMDEYPEVTYSQSQTAVYAMMERYHPALFERIRQRVKEGRWEVAAVHWVEGDKNIASGESIVRHLLESRAYCQEKFGLAPEDIQLDWEPDTFGHANTIPSILTRAGVKYYYSCRTGGGHGHDRIGDERPPLFWWEGPDGSRILVNRETTWYNSYVNIGENFAIPAVAFAKATGLRDWMNVFGIGNHGGGPTRKEIDYFLETREWPVWPNVVFGRAQDWYRRIEAEIHGRKLDIPVIAHELNFEFTGCYTSESAIKKANRLGESACVEAETLAAITGVSTATLSDAWRNVLFNQFHDILPGSGVQETRDHALGIAQQTMAATGAIKREALLKLAGDLDTLSLLPDTPAARTEREKITNPLFEGGVGLLAGETGFSTPKGGGRFFRPVMLFNPCAWERTEMVELTLYDWEGDTNRIVARDADGRHHPTLLLEHTQANQEWWMHGRTRLLFEATVPALGYATYVFMEGTPDEGPRLSVEGETTFRGEAFEIALDRFQPGVRMVSVGDTPIATGLEPIGVWEFVREQSRGMTAWAIGKEEFVGYLPASTYALRGVSWNQGTAAAQGSAPMVAATHELVVPETKSKVKLHTVVSASQPRVDFLAEIDWREIGTHQDGIPGLRVDFETYLDGPARYETPFGSVERELEDGEEVPTLRYAYRESTEADQFAAMTLVQDSKYGHAVDGSTLAMRVVRSSFDPDHAPEVRKSTLRYALFFHTEPQPPSATTRLGAAFNHPLLIVPAPLQSGASPVRKSYAEVLTPNVVLHALKPGVDGGIVIRVAEMDGVAGEVTVRLDPSLHAGADRAEVTDLLERPTGELARLEGDRLTFQVPAHGIVTVRLK